MKRNYFTDGMFGLVVGDALGSPAQFHRRGEVKIEGMIPCEHFKTPAGAWTDDSSMALATLDSMNREFLVSVESIADNFVKWLCDGAFTPYGYAYDIGTTCMQAIKNYKWMQDVTECGLTGDQSNGNGSLMRILPVCIPSNASITEVEMVSAITHAHRRAVIGCGLYYFMAQAIIYGEGRLENRLAAGIGDGFEHYFIEDELKHYNRLEDWRAFSSLGENKISSSGYVVHTLEAAVWCLLNTNTYKDAVLKAANLGDDADSVAAVCGGLAGLYYGYEAIPREWLKVIPRRKWIEKLCVKGGEEYATVEG